MRPSNLLLSLALLAAVPAAPGEMADTESACPVLSPVAGELLRSAQSRAPLPDRLIAPREDSRYGLPLSDFWPLWRECLGNSAAREIEVADRPGPAALRALHRAGRADRYGAPAGPGLAAEVSIERYPAFRAGLRICLLGPRADTVQCASIPDLKALETVPALASSFFPRLYGSKAFDLVEFRQNAVVRLEKALFRAGSAGVLPGDRYAFSGGSGTAEPEQLEILTRVLTGHFGLILEDGAPGKASLETDGSLRFMPQAGAALRVDSMVEAPALVDRHRAWDVDNFTVLIGKRPTPDGRRQAIPMVVPFSKVSDQFPDLGRTIQREIDSNLAQAYGRSLGRPDFGYLGRVFRGKETRILKGRVINTAAGVDSVQYAWTTADAYLRSLRERVEAGQRFEVGLTLLRVYQDRPNSGRFWGIVSQTWTTRFQEGGRYRDDGILFVNFDLKPGSGALEQFRIFYRFWFHNYRKDIRRQGPDREPVLVTRKQRLAEAITATLDQSADLPPEISFGRMDDAGSRFILDPTDRGISGVDMDLLRTMRDDLLHVMQ